MESLSSESYFYFNPVKKRICFVTEVDLDRRGFGGITSDQQILRCLRKFGEVDVIYLQKMKYKSTALALMFFLFNILKSFSKPYQIYFSRGLITSMYLVVFKNLMRRRVKIVHRGLSVPLGSKEVKYLRYGKFESFFRFYIFSFLEHVMLSHVNVIIVAADEYGDDLIRVGVKSDRIHVVPFFVEDEFFDQPFKKNASGPFNFGYVGGFHLYHDMLPLIEAFELFIKDETNAQLILVGDGLSRYKIEREVIERKLADKVRFLGKVSHTSIPKLLSQIDCFILLTYASGLPIGLLEAAAAGKPIITVKKETDLTIGRFFNHGKEIYFVNSIALDEITRSMRLLYEDSHLRNTIAYGARQVAQQNFSEKVTLKQLQKLIQKIS